MDGATARIRRGSALAVALAAVAVAWLAAPWTASRATLLAARPAARAAALVWVEPRRAAERPSREPTRSVQAERRAARLAFARASYLEWAAYPPFSRPIAERPDRHAPHRVGNRLVEWPGTEAAGDEPAAERTPIAVELAQDRYYLVGDERAVLALQCRRGDEPAHCVVRRAVAAPPADLAPTAARAAVVFRAEGPGAWRAELAPRGAGFADWHGPLHVAVEVDAGSAEPSVDPSAPTLVVGFDVDLTPSAPARWTGNAEDRLRDGSVEVCSELDVAVPGRYRFDGRFADRDGRTFALASARVDARVGPTAVCFTLFGKLVLDEGAPGPWVLRDVEGFLLLEDTFPDRQTVPGWDGVLHETRAYASSELSDAEWESEAKARYRAAVP